MPLAEEGAEVEGLVDNDKPAQVDMTAVRRNHLLVEPSVDI